jgi:hypothetical protein
MLALFSDCQDFAAVLPVCTQEQEELAAAGYDAEVLVEAAQVSLEGICSTLNRLPPLDWVQGQGGRGGGVLQVDTFTARQYSPTS